MDNTAIKELQNLEKQLLFKRSQIDDDIDNVRKTLSLLAGNKNFVEYPLFSNEDIELNYNQNATWVEKVKLALSYIHKGYVSDICNFLEKYDTTDKKTLNKRVTITVSSLQSKKGELIKVGQKGRAIEVALKKA